MDPATDELNCGGCGNECAGNATAVSCVASSCQYVCQPGYADCDQTAPNLTGCETQLNTVTNCGGCGNTCDTVNSNGASCDGIGCHYSSCKPGFADCNQAAPNLLGCETPITTVTNCGGCNVACGSQNTASVSCNGIKCLYTCQQGFSNCNQSGSNTAGCECATPGCCGTSCQVIHDTGLGEHFYDCIPRDTYNQTQASKACAAHTGNPGQCTAFTCADNGHVVCDNSGVGTTCNCWKYDGTTTVGRVNSQCLCPSTGDPAWH